MAGGIKGIFFGEIGVVVRLVGAGVVDIGGLRVARGGKATVLAAGPSITGTTFLVLLASRASPGQTGLGTGGDLVSTLLVGSGGDQLAVGGQADATVGWVARESGGGGDEIVGHQAQDKAVLAGGKPIQLGIGEAAAQSGLGRQILRVKSQASAVAEAPFGGAQFRPESGPIPLAIDSQKSSQA